MSCTPRKYGGGTSSATLTSRNTNNNTSKIKKKQAATAMVFTNTRSALKKNLDNVVLRREAQRHEQEMRDVHRVRVAEEMGRPEHDPLVELRLQHELKTSDERHKELHGSGGGGEGGGTGNGDNKHGSSGGSSYASSFSGAQQEVIRTRQLVDHFRARAQIAQAGVVVVDTINALVDVDDVKLFPRPPPAPRHGGGLGGASTARSVIPLRQRPNFLKGLASATGDQSMADGDFMAESRKHSTIDGGGDIEEGGDAEGDMDHGPTQQLRAHVKQQKNKARRNHIWAQYEEIAQRLQQGAHQQGSTHSSMIVPPRDENDDHDGGGGTNASLGGGGGGVGSKEVADDLRALLRSEQDRIEATGRGGGAADRGGRAHSVSNDGDEFPSSNDSSYAEITVTAGGGYMDDVGGSRRRDRLSGGSDDDDVDDDSWSYCGCTCHNDDDIDDACSQCTCDDHSRSFSEDDDSSPSRHSPHHLQDLSQSTPSPTTSPRNKNVSTRVIEKKKKPIDVALQSKREELQKLRRAMKKRTRGIDGTPPGSKHHTNTSNTSSHTDGPQSSSSTVPGTHSNNHVDAIEEAKEALRVAHMRGRATHLLNAALEDASLLLTSAGRLRTHPAATLKVVPGQQKQIPRAGSNSSEIRSVDNNAATSDVEDNHPPSPIMPLSTGATSHGKLPSSSPTGTTSANTDTRHKFKVWMNGVQFPQSQWKDTFDSNANNPEDFRFLRHYQPPEIVLHERADLISERIFAASTFVDLGSVGGGGVFGGSSVAASSGLSPDLQRRLQLASNNNRNNNNNNNDRDDTSTTTASYGGSEFTSSGGGSGMNLVPDPTRKGFLPSIYPSSLSSIGGGATTTTTISRQIGKGAAVQLCREPSYAGNNINNNTRLKNEGGPLSPPSLSNSMMLGGGNITNAVSIGNFSGVFEDGGGGSGSYHTDLSNHGSGGAVAFGIPDNTSPYEAIRLPPEFSSTSTSKIAEVVASDACDMILASENIMRYVNECVKQGRRSGSVENEFDKMDRCALRGMLWSSECTQQTRRLVQGAKGIKSGIEHELSEKRKDVVDAVEDVANQNHKIAKLQNEVDSLLKEAKETESTVAFQWSLLHSSSSSPQQSPSPPPTTSSVPPPQRRRPLHHHHHKHHHQQHQQVSTRAQPRHLLRDFDAGLAALSRLRQHLIKWSILRGKNTATFNTTPQQQQQQQGTTVSGSNFKGGGDALQSSMSFKTGGGGGSSMNFGEMSGSIPNFPGPGGGNTSSSNNSSNPSQRISMALSPLASLFSTKGAAAKLKAQQQHKSLQVGEQSTTTTANQDAPSSSAAVGGGSGGVGGIATPPQGVSPSSPPSSPKVEAVDNSVDAAFQALLGELVSRQKVSSLWREMVDTPTNTTTTAPSSPSSPPSRTDSKTIPPTPTTDP